MKKTIKILGMLPLLVLLVSCSTTSKKTSHPSHSSSSKVTNRTSKTKTSAKEKVQNKIALKRVGSADYGYISIPEKWIHFTDVEGGDSIQYTDGTGYNIVTMNGFDREKANVPEGETLTAEMIANRSVYVWHDHPDVEKMWGAKTTVAGNEAFQVNVVMKTSQLMISWIFQNGDKVYLISFEGDAETLAQFIPYIEETWSLSE